MKIRVPLLAIVVAAMFLAVAYAQENKRERPKLPEGVQGFSGTVQGKVVSMKEDRFIFQVDKVLKVWKNNKAEKPENLAGAKILVRARSKEGKQAKFIKTLKVDETLSLEVLNESVRGGETCWIVESSCKRRA